MADTTKILDIDIDNIIRKSSELKEELDDLRKQQDKLKKSNDTSSESFVKLDAAIKKTSSEYNNNQKQLAALNKSGSEFLTINQKADASLKLQVQSIQDARENNTALLAVRNRLNLLDKDQLKLADEINKKLDQNNAFIKENVSAYEKQKIGIGDYKTAITDALKETGLMGGQLGQIKSTLDSFSLPLNTLKDDFKDAFSQIKNASKDTEGLTQAQKANAVATNIGSGALKVFKLALIGLGIGIIIAAVGLLINYLRTFDPVMDRVEQVFSAVGAVVEVVSKAIFDFVKGLTDLEATANKIKNFFKDPIGTIKEFGNEMKEAAKAAIELKKAQQDLEDVTILQEVANARASQQIKELILQSKNRALSEEERIKKLKQANDLEEQNYKERAALAERELDIAQRSITTKAGITETDIKLLKERGTAYAIYLKEVLNVTDEEVKALQQAEIAKLKILEESTGIREKIQNQTDALEEKRKAAEEKRIKEAQEARAKSIEKALAQSKQELELFIAQQGFKARSLQEEVILEQEITAKRLANLKQEYEAKKKTTLEYETERLNIVNEYLLKEAQLAIDYARRRTEQEIASIPDVLDKEKFLTELILSEEQKRLDLIAEKNRNFQALRLEKGIIDEQTYQDEITKIQTETDQKKKDLDEQKRLADVEKREIDLANQRAYEDLVFRENLEINLERLEQQRVKEVEAAAKSGADIEKINQKFAAAKRDLENKSTVAQIDNARMALGEVTSLITGFFGENKLLSAAMASVDAFLMAQKAYLSQLVPGDPSSVPRAVIAGVKAGAFGALNVAKILGVKFEKGGIPFEGGILKGPSHSQGGIPTPFGEMEGKEAVINKKSTSMFRGLLSAINVAGGGRAFARGGIPNISSISNSLFKTNRSQQTFDYDLLAGKIAEANMMIPPNNLSIEEFDTKFKNYTNIVEGSNHG